MFKVYDDFSNYDVNKQPYSFDVERHTSTENMHAWVKENRFFMSSIGNRYILNTPYFLTGSFKMSFRLTFLEEINPSFVVILQYDERLRKGTGIQFTYDLSGAMEMSLVSVDKGAFAVINQGEKKAVEPLDEEHFYPLYINIGEKNVSGSVAGVDFSFELATLCGKLAIERHNFIGELLIDNVEFESNDEFKFENLLQETMVDIPCINGGDIPYNVSWKIDKTEDDCYLAVKLAGGTKTRRLNREEREGQYVAELDRMTNPYIGLRLKNNTRLLFYIFNGEKGFVDPNIYWDCLKPYFDDVEIPLCGVYKVAKEDVENIEEVFFGYDNLHCSGYGAQVGGCEFRFSVEGKLIDYGMPMDGRDIYEVLSSENKLAMTLIPENCYERETVIEHLKYNHYFDVSEIPAFTLVMKTVKNPDYFAFGAEMINVFESEVLHTTDCVSEVEEGTFGYKVVKVGVKLPKTAVGVYKIRFNVYYGERLYNSVVKTFEVFNKDTDENPVLASGLPYVFSMPNELKWLMRNSFDMWSPARSCEVEHYITCITDTPFEAQTRRSWEIAKLFKREWFAWIASRTLPAGWKLEDYEESFKNADYIFTGFNETKTDLSEGCLYPMRLDKHSYGNFCARYEDRIEVLEDFMGENPQIAEKVGYVVGSREFTFEHFKALCADYLTEWNAYQDKHALDIVKNQNEELKKVNPNFKRAMYGPLALYYSPTLSYHSVKNNMMTVEHLADTVYTGFAILEDYPYSCSYQTHRGAFFMMTLLLHCPEIVVYPEQYNSGAGGCIDGAVKFAHAPMGKYDIEPYYNATLAYEYVFNTPYRTKDGFGYWNTYGFHRSDVSDDFMNCLVREWKYVVENKPKKPLKSMAFLAEFDESEDRFEIRDVNNGCVKTYINNRSESGLATIFECSRSCGVPNGFAIGFDGLVSLGADECDVLVVPSLKNVGKEYKAEIRRLYNSGVNLIAVSDVSGLEDIFGVVPKKTEKKISRVVYGNNSEFVRESTAELLYMPMPASKVCMVGDDDSALIICTENTALINAAVYEMGADDAAQSHNAKTHFVVGELIRNALSDVILELSDSVAVGKGVGITAFETKDGRTMLMAIDYTPFDNTELKEKEVSVKINLENVKEIVSETEVFAGKKDGFVKELVFNIKPHESKFFELKVEKKGE